MDNLTRGLSELSAEDSNSLEGIKTDEPMESSQSGSVTSTDNSEVVENTKHIADESSSKLTEAESKVENTITTRSSKKRGCSLSKLNGNQTMKFMENFDPEHSNRERKKLTRQISTSGKRKPTLYDERGVMMSADVDLCDCLNDQCPGCHFPCPKCLSNKCGHECRQNRRWTYEEIWFEGTNKAVFNPLIGSK